ncbi:thiamine diphosphokinase [Metabacillus litoralis]|uniref:thiamine diphosphokinase n=1 Tax=Metabacillus litoralis TaxID=152268 RepID=UPI001CFECF92|nr:thiamine diphosphokinase [Metabacillus litoralis]
MKTIAIVAGGPRENLANLVKYHNDDVIWIGVDGGVKYIKEFGLPYQFAFGDFDSISSSEKKQLIDIGKEVLSFSPEKDKTDTEIALEWAIKQRPTKVHIFGATGGRIDHLLANIYLLMQSIEFDSMIEIIDKQNHITLYTPGTYTIRKDDEKKYTSLIPISLEVRGITLKGFKYPLNNCHIKLGSTLCISNELIHEVGTFSFEDGILLLIRSRD